MQSMDGKDHCRHPCMYRWPKILRPMVGCLAGHAPMASPLPLINGDLRATCYPHSSYITFNPRNQISDQHFSSGATTFCSSCLSLQHLLLSHDPLLWGHHAPSRAHGGGLPWLVCMEEATACFCSWVLFFIWLLI